MKLPTLFTFVFLFLSTIASADEVYNTHTLVYSKNKGKVLKAIELSEKAFTFVECDVHDQKLLSHAEFVSNHCEPVVAKIYPKDDLTRIVFSSIFLSRLQNRVKKITDNKQFFAASQLMSASLLNLRYGFGVQYTSESISAFKFNLQSRMENYNYYFDLRMTLELTNQKSLSIEDTYEKLLLPENYCKKSSPLQTKDNQSVTAQIHQLCDKVNLRKDNQPVVDSLREALVLSPEQFYDLIKKSLTESITGEEIEEYIL